MRRGGLMQKRFDESGFPDPRLACAEYYLAIREERLLCADG